MSQAGHSITLLPLDLPDGLDCWLVEFVGEVRRETELLAENGAQDAVAAREALLRKFVRHAASHYSQALTIPEADAVIGRAEETVRRMVRNGVLTDTRVKPHGHMRVTRGELARVATKKRRKYDPVADAQAAQEALCEGHVSAARHSPKLNVAVARRGAFHARLHVGRLAPPIRERSRKWPRAVNVPSCPS